MRAASFGLVAAIAFASVAAGAQTVADDARCLLVSSSYARGSKDPKAQAVAQTAAAFYLGRVDGRYPPAALKTAFAAELKLVNGGNAGAIMNACAARIGQAETRIQAIAPAPPAAAASPPPAPRPATQKAPVGR
jgi:hypothetical protein